MIKIPTDNLYKFIAIFGLVLIGFSGYAYLEMFEAHKASVLIETSTFHGWKQDSYASEEKLIDSINDRRIREAKKDTNRHIDNEKFNLKLKKMQDSIFNQFENDFILMNYHRNKYIVYRNAVIFSAAVGFILMFAGFILWYFKLQRFIDKQVKLQK